MDDAQPEIRIGDRERREVDARLQQAHADGVLTLTEYDERAALCWAARTRSDLDRLTRDLPPAEPPTTVAKVPGPVRRPELSRGLVHRALGGLVAVVLVGTAAVLGGQALTADDGVSLFGQRELQVGGDQDRMEVGMLFGRVTVRVPDDVRARTAGTVLFGGIDCAAACTGRPDQREVVVDATGAFGRVEVLRANEPSRADRDRIDDRDNDRDD